MTWKTTICIIFIGITQLSHQNSNAFTSSSHSRNVRHALKDKVTFCFKSTQHDEFDNPQSYVQFESPLLEAGYPPAVNEYETNTRYQKPLLVYLPGFDGTLLAPFLQFPELHTEFDVKGMVVDMKDRSSVEDLKHLVLDFICQEMIVKIDNQITHRPVYIMGESFGGILALEVALSIIEWNKSIQGVNDDLTSSSSTDNRIHLQGITLINSATCYLESNLAKHGPPVTKVSSIMYPLEVLKLVPLFTDKYAIPQLLLILQSKALPSIIDNEQKEAYLGRTAFNLPTKLKFMPQETLQWRLDQWLLKGCLSWKEKEHHLQTLNIPVLIVAGEDDNTLPSVQEAYRLSDLFSTTTSEMKPSVHIVQGAGHACTCGSRLDITALMRNAFYNQLMTNGRRAMKPTASQNSGEYFGMEERYDKASIGLNPLRYWSKDNFSILRLG